MPKFPAATETTLKCQANILYCIQLIHRPGKPTRPGVSTTLQTSKCRYARQPLCARTFSGRWALSAPQLPQLARPWRALCRKGRAGPLGGARVGRITGSAGCCLRGVTAGSHPPAAEDPPSWLPGPPSSCGPGTASPAPRRVP